MQLKNMQLEDTTRNLNILIVKFILGFDLCDTEHLIVKDVDLCLLGK